jgi:hypothetical protein
MAGVTTALVVAGLIAGAVSSSKAASAAKKQTEFAKSESQRAQQAEIDRINAQRYSPGAGFAPMGFDAILSVFGHSMAGKMSGFNVDEARQRIGLVDQNGNKGPLWDQTPGGFDAYRNWAMAGRGPMPGANWDSAKYAANKAARTAAGTNPTGRDDIWGGMGNPRDGSLSPTMAWVFGAGNMGSTAGGGATFANPDMGESRSRFAA